MSAKNFIWAVEVLLEEAYMIKGARFVLLGVW